ncbi:MAG: DUF4234 domain-containing protein [Lachnospiraceae bacterium]|nr:DUF4234 domain-containing protein [Lachnospiraceae bacterium]
MQKKDIAMCVILSIVTCGIYGIYWFVTLTDDVNAASGEQGATSGGISALLTIVTCGIYGIYWAYKQGERINKAKQLRGLPDDTNTPILYLILYIVGLGIVANAIMQNELNQLIEM